MSVKNSSFFDNLKLKLSKKVKGNEKIYFIEDNKSFHLKILYSQNNKEKSRYDIHIALYHNKNNVLLYKMVYEKIKEKNIPLKQFQMVLNFKEIIEDSFSRTIEENKNEIKTFEENIMSFKKMNKTDPVSSSDFLISEKLKLIEIKKQIIEVSPPSFFE